MDSLQEFRHLCAEIIARLEENQSADWWKDIAFLTQRLEAARKGLALGWHPPERPNHDEPALVIVQFEKGWESSPEPNAAHLKFVRHHSQNFESGIFLLSRDPEQESCSLALIRGERRPSRECDCKAVYNDDGKSMRWAKKDGTACDHFGADKELRPRTVERLIGPEQIRLNALKVARQWLRAAERGADTSAAQRPLESGGNRGSTRKPSAKGSQDAKILGYLTIHHRYENGHCENYTAAESADIAKAKTIPSATVSDFLKRHFPATGSPRQGYETACSKNHERLLHWFMVQHGDNLPVRTDNIENYDEDDIRQKW